MNPINPALTLTLLLALTTAAPAQSPAPTPTSNPPAAVKPVRRGRIVKQPVINLARQAAERRPGQVMPGDPPLEKFAPPIPAPALPAPPAPTLTTPPPPPTPAEIDLTTPTRDPTTGGSIKPAPAPVEPGTGPRPSPKKDSVPAPTPPPAPDALPLLRPPPARSPSAGFAPSSPTTITLFRVDGETTGLLLRPAGGGPELSSPINTPQTGRFEVFTGLDTEADFDLAGRAQVHIGRLSRITFDEHAPGRPSVFVELGSIELRRIAPTQTGDITVRTPDRPNGQAFPGSAKITYSAFSGTRVEPGSAVQAGR
jgi:hypothetical protein